MGFSVAQQVIRNPQGQIKFWKPGERGREHYHIGVWIEGSPEDLARVDHVEFVLHPSFKRPVRSSANRDNKFGVTFWTWGTFQIEVRIHMLDGSIQTLQHYLNYELPADDGTNYVAVEA